MRGGEAWRLLPHDFPPWQTVCGHYWRWRSSGLWERLNAASVPAVRQQAGRQTRPSAAIIASQGVKAAEGGEERGTGVHKQVNGRKRHIVVGVSGLLLLAVVHSAGIPEGTGANCSWRNSLRASSVVSTTGGAARNSSGPMEAMKRL